MTVPLHIRRAARVLDDGGVIAYPTEGVYGLGCLPDDYAAVSRILEIKGRDPGKGLVVIAATLAQVDDWIELPPNPPDLSSSIDKPVTWILPATDAVPWWIRGEHAGVAVRLTAHPVANALCEAAGSPLVSTSANVSGHPPARNPYILRRQFSRLVDCIVPGRCGPAGSASEIRDLVSGKVLRPA